MGGFGWETFALTEGKGDKIEKSDDTIQLENDFLKVNFGDHGQIDVYNKETETLHENFFYYENTGDIGNEYIYRQSADNSFIYSTEFKADYEVLESNALYKQIKMTQTWEIPKSADDLLTYEQISVTEMRIRKATRSKEYIPYTVETIFTLRYDDSVMKIDTTINNTAKDHRIRAIFDSGLNVETHVAESVFEVIERPNKVSDRWENPENPQRQQAFMSIHDDNYGLTLMNHGLHEYEVLDNRYVAITILRATGEMGDWGYFPTPEAQCLDTYTMNLGYMFTNNQTRNESYRKAYAFQVPLQTTQINSKDAILKPKDTFLDFGGDSVMVTALKASDQKDFKVLRFYNLSSETEGQFELNKTSVHNSNLVEEKLDALTHKTIKPAEIKTVLID